MNQMVSYNTSANSFAISDCGTNTSSSGSYTLGSYYPIYDPWNWWYDHHHYHYSYPVYTESKIDKAFRVMKKLFSKGLVKTMPIEKFMEIVHEIAQEL